MQKKTSNINTINAKTASISKYIAASIISLCGIYAAGIIIMDANFLRIIMLLTLAGFYISFLWRKRNYNFSLLEYPVLLLCTVLCLLSISTAGTPSLLSSAAGETSKAALLGRLLCWMIALRSFSLKSDTSLLFGCIPTMAMFGLVAASNSEERLVPIFLFFIFASVFLLISEQGNVASKMGKKALPFAEFAWQAFIAAVCLTPSLLLASSLSGPLLAFTTQYTQINRAYHLQHTDSSTQHRGIDPLNESREMKVGTGPTDNNNTIIMNVSATEPAYWRGNTYDRYTGTDWQSSLPLNISLPFFASGRKAIGHYVAPETTLTQGDKSRHQLWQTFKLYDPMLTNIYGAGEIRDVDMFPVRLRTDGAGTIKILDDFDNQYYIVSSSVPDIIPAKLRTASPDYPPSISSIYLQLPYSPDSTVYRQLRQLALGITRKCSNNFDRVMALKSWISSHCEYNLHAKAIPTGIDAAQSFLFINKEGYCDSFATGLAVLCRIIGIPSRIAVGFAPGEEANGNFLVREKDRHAWTEVFFSEFGWIPFDATEGTKDITNEQKGFLAWIKSLGMNFNAPWLPLCLAVAGVAGILLALIKEGNKRPDSSNVTQTAMLGITNRRIAIAYEKACSKLGRHNLIRPQDYTPLEYLLFLYATLPQPDDVLSIMEELTNLFNRYRYSSDEATEEQAIYAETLLNNLLPALKRISSRIHMTSQSVR
jgi:transglutaminase-like putative cysteine protease